MVKKLVIAIFVSVLAVVFLPLGIGLYLSPQDPLEKADAIVVVSGGDTDARISEGVKLYQQEWAPIIIFSGAAAEGDVSNALAMKRIAIENGVPEDSILIEEESKTTTENAEFTAEIIKKESLNSIILVTSPYHQRRAYTLFRGFLGEDFKIINHSAKDLTWRKKNWWESANARFLTFAEILKNFYEVIRGNVDGR